MVGGWAAGRWPVHIHQPQEPPAAPAPARHSLLPLPILTAAAPLLAGCWRLPLGDPLPAQQLCSLFPAAVAGAQLQALLWLKAARQQLCQRSAAQRVRQLVQAQLMTAASWVAPVLGRCCCWAAPAVDPCGILSMCCCWTAPRLAAEGGQPVPTAPRSLHCCRLPLLATHAHSQQQAAALGRFLQHDTPPLLAAAWGPQRGVQQPQASAA